MHAEAPELCWALRAFVMVNVTDILPLPDPVLWSGVTELPNLVTLALTGSIDGGTGANSLVLADGNNTISVTTPGFGTVTDTDLGTNPISGTFNDIDSITGGSGVDTFDFAANILALWAN